MCNFIVYKKTKTSKYSYLELIIFLHLNIFWLFYYS
jgi:hypothetical protein